MIELFNKSLIKNIINVWWDGQKRRWKYGTIRRLPHGDVAICLKGGKIRNVIPYDEIVLYNLKYKIVKL